MTSADQLACIDIPAFPLQLLLRRHPDWRDHPAVVVDEDRPQGTILWANAQARSLRILPGHRYAQGLSLAADLRAGEVSSEEITTQSAQIATLLRDFTPEVDPCSGEPGVFWLNASGLDALFPSLAGWAKQILRRLKTKTILATVAIGFSRFACYATARERKQTITIFKTPTQEREHTKHVLLERLNLAPSLRDDLARLGVTTLGEFLRLPPGGLLERFGNEAFRLHRLASGEAWDPLQPEITSDPLTNGYLFDDPERDIDRLIFAIKRTLHPLLKRLADSKAAATILFLEFTLRIPGQKDQCKIESIRPAEPTLDVRIILRLLRLRLERFFQHDSSLGIVELKLSADSVVATREQLQLFQNNKHRDIRAANEALARICAELGNHSVVKAVLRDAHLPEAQFSWQAFTGLKEPTQIEATPNTQLIRTICRPVPLPIQTTSLRDDGWLLRGSEYGCIERLLGPYIISGGWWANEVHREYHFAYSQRGYLLWLFYDQRRRRWFEHGQIA